MSLYLVISKELNTIIIIIIIIIIFFIMKRVWNQHFLLIDAGKVALMPRFARDHFFSRTLELEVSAYMTSAEPHFK